MDTIQTILFIALPLILAITVHESAHAYVADYFGDPTARELGRISLNPLRHIDPFGTLVLPLFLHFITHGAFAIGYAKPVPVNYAKMRNPKKQMGWVAFAGPASNLAMAWGWLVFGHLMKSMEVDSAALQAMAQFGVLINSLMFAFNLFPLPPLDGGRVLTALLPPKWAAQFAKIEVFGFFIVLLLVANHGLDFWMRPMQALVDGVLKFLTSPLTFFVN